MFFIRILNLLFLISLALYAITLAFPLAAVSLAEAISSPIRELMHRIGSISDIPLFEAAVLISPILIFLLVFYFVLKSKDPRRSFLNILSVISLAPTVYLLAFGIPSNAPSVFSEYKREVTVDQMRFASEALVENINSDLCVITNTYPDSGFYRNAYIECNKILHGAGDDSDFAPRVKQFLTPVIPRLAGVAAKYSPITGEITVDPCLPRYTYVFSVCHELAHGAGAVREDEAGFLAFLASAASDDPYLRYSANLTMLEYLLADIRKNDAEMYTEVYKTLPQTAKNDIASYREYYGYRETAVGAVAERFNGAYRDVMSLGEYSDVSVLVTAYLLSA